MKTTWLTGSFIIVAATVLSAAPESPQELQRAYAMQKAVLRDDASQAESLLKAGFSPYNPIGCGRFDSLDGAVQTANPEMVRLLLRYGARPRPDTFVHAAFINNEQASLDILRQFVAAGADVNSLELSCGNPKMTWTAIDQAVWRQHREVVRFLLSQKDIRVNVVNGDGLTPLMIAVEKGDPTLVQQLLVAGADPRWPTPLHEHAFTTSGHQIETQRSLPHPPSASLTAAN